MTYKPWDDNLCDSCQERPKEFYCPDCECFFCHACFEREGHIGEGE